VTEKNLGYFKFLTDFPDNMQELAQFASGEKISFKPRQAQNSLGRINKLTT
jgi:hypothetical protein